VAASCFALDDEGDSCMTTATHAFDLLFVGEERLLLRANHFASCPSTDLRECWSMLDALDLSERDRVAPVQACKRPRTSIWAPHEWGRWGDPALDVRVIPGAPLLAIRWPLPQWRAVDGGVELQEEFTIVDTSAQPVLEIAQPASARRAEPDPEFNLAEPLFRAWRHEEWFRMRSPQRFSLVRALDGAWIDYRAVIVDGEWSVVRDV
jgi:hypothetical protein